MNGDELVPMEGCEVCRKMMEPGELGKMKAFYIDTSGHMMMSELLGNLRRDFDMYGDLPVQYFSDGGILNFKHPI